MADNYTRQGETFRAKETGAVKAPVTLVGTHVQTPKGQQKLTVAGTAVALTVPSGATNALARVETAAIRYKRDGNDPTATDGILLMEFEAVELTSLSAVKLIRTTATSATVHLDYYAFE